MKGNKHLSDDEIISQAILFFFAGFETTASTIVNTLFEFTKYPETQEKLYHEIKEKLEHADKSDLTKYYEIIINDIPYLDAALKETLRKYPVLPRLERRLAADDYELGGIKLERDDIVEISSVAVHYDERNYPDPQRFDPERFMPENKANLDPYAFIPFGIGPRNCIGMRFAYQEAKVCLALLSQKYYFKKCSTTPENLIFNRGTINLFPQAFDISIEYRR